MQDRIEDVIAEEEPRQGCCACGIQLSPGLAVNAEAP